MDLYRFISIDRFDKDNLNSLAYFLSHCHTDHMVGLDCDTFATTLCNRDNVRLYVCEVTKILLLSDPKYQHLKPHITVLPIEEPKVFFLINVNKDVDKILVGFLYLTLFYTHQI